MEPIGCFDDVCDLWKFGGHAAISFHGLEGIVIESGQHLAVSIVQYGVAIVFLTADFIVQGDGWRIVWLDFKDLFIPLFRSDQMLISGRAFRKGFGERL